MRVCLIGYGYWGKNLARVFGKDLVGICDYNEDNLDKAKELYDVQYFQLIQLKIRNFIFGLSRENSTLL